MLLLLLSLGASTFFFFSPNFHIHVSYCCVVLLFLLEAVSSLIFQFQLNHQKNKKRNRSFHFYCVLAFVYFCATESILRIYRARTSGRGSDREKEERARLSHHFLSCTFRDLRGCVFSFCIFYSSFVVVFVSLLNDRVCSYIENQRHNEASLAGLFPLTVQVLCHTLPLKTKAAAAELACGRQRSKTARPE